MSNFLMAEHFQISSYGDVWPMIQLLTVYSLNSVMDLSCQKRWSFTFPAHDLKLPDTCMFGGVLLPGDVFHVAPPGGDGFDNSSWFSSTVHVLAEVGGGRLFCCERPLHLLQLCGHCGESVRDLFC